MKPMAIGILGSGRSGTSMVTRAVQLLGVDLGNSEHLMAPHSMNPKGFWENKKIVNIHERMIKEMNWSWDGAYLLPNDWSKKPRIAALSEELKRYIQLNFSHKRYWAWKDPRTCTFLPIWKEILNELDMGSAFVIVVRNPVDVTNSLLKLNNQWNREDMLRIWTFRTLSSLFRTEQFPRAVVHYDQFLNNWRGPLRTVASRIGIPWPASEDRLVNSMKNFISPELRHSLTNWETLKGSGIPTVTIQTYQLCLDAAGSPAILDTLSFKRRTKALFQQYIKGL
jgi:hypothetical protein